MRNLPRFSRWSLPLCVFCLLAISLVWTGRTAAQDGGPSKLHQAFGVARAIVVDIQDPDGAGRIKIKLPFLGNEVELWARVSLPLGGNKTGLWALPDIGDEVLVAFEEEDPRRPFVLGSVWNGKRPPD
jgi:uncharacterized protein involved in type VI secretion and phage assembly